MKTTEKLLLNYNGNRTKCRVLFVFFASFILIFC